MQPSDPPLLPEQVLQARVAELAEYVSRDFAGCSASGGCELTVVVVLKGALFFAADLIRRLSVPVTVEFVRAKSYEGTRAGEAVDTAFLFTSSLEGKSVLLVEDILDTGRTTSAIIEQLRRQTPARLALCVLLDKPARRELPMVADYVGFTIDDQFVVGYGLDFEERYRDLPGIHVLVDDEAESGT